MGNTKRIMIKRKLLSIVIPAYNEEKNIPIIYKEITKVWEKYLMKKYAIEILFVNDGSIDQTWNEIKKLRKKDKSVKGICLVKNFGHQSALQTGLERATGDAVISIDCDLQHPPILITKLVKAWEDGASIVNTLRKDSVETSVFKKITSNMFYKLINAISTLELRQGEADFRLIDKKTLQVINALPEEPKFYRGLVNWVGYSKTYIPYVASPREYGHSTYTLRKMLELARMGITSFTMMPLKIILVTGVIITICSVLLLIVLSWYKLFVNFHVIDPVVFLILMTMLSTGILIMMQGIISIYLIDVYNLSKKRPSYIIGETLGISL